MLLGFLVVVANVLGAGMIVPQVVRLRRHRVAGGVSETWVGVGIAMNTWWLAYALSERLWGLVPVSAVALVLYGVIALQLGGLLGPAGLRRVGRSALAVGAAPLPFLVLGGWSVTGVVIGLAYAVQFSPAALAAVRARDLTGVSALTWGMAFVEAAIWLVYGLAEGAAALIVGGAGGAVMSAVVLGCLARRPAAVACLATE